MNGAKAVVLASINSTESKINTKINGNSQNFFLLDRKPQRSFKKSIIHSCFLILIGMSEIFCAE